MALVARGVDSGTGINVLADAGATGDMQVVKLAIATLGSEALSPGDATNGLDVDVTRIIPGVTATALGKAEDAVAASGDTGVGVLAVQRNTAVSDAADGDYVFLHTDSLGRLQVSGTQLEDAAAASGDPGHFVLAVRRDAPTSGAAAGDYHEISVDALGRLWTSGTYAEDAAAVSGDYGKFILAVRRDAPTSSAAAGDYHEVQVDALGRLWVSGTHAEDAAATSGDYGHFALAIRRDAQVADAADGDYTGIHVDSLGRLQTADRNQTSEINVSALDDDLVVKASAGRLFGFAGYSTTSQFIQVHDATSLPADTAVPELVFPIVANAPFSIDIPRGHPCTVGIVIANSTTGPTLTSGAADTWITAYYE